MRHSRIKQLALYVYQGSTERYKNFKNQRCSCGTKNFTIDENVKSQPYCKTIDPTFNWRRKALVNGKNTVFFQKDGWLHVIRVKTQ